jgi:predicted metal-dependent hydrolase
VTDAPGSTGSASTTVLQGGRRKAYRPLPDAERATAFRAGIDAYERGDFFEAHELLEPAWMGTADVAERDLYQGLIKLAAAFVHDVRGNRTGVAKNLAGARDRLQAALDGGSTVQLAHGIDVEVLLSRVESTLATVADEDAPVEPPPLRRSPR